MAYDNVAVLIPAYKPDAQLIQVVNGLLGIGFSRIVVVDDGNGEAGRPIFEQLKGKAEVLCHEVNRGKGAALKTGLKHLMTTEGLSVVTADADGQHTPADCARIADALIANPGALILGVRDKRRMPMRSKTGNVITCFTVWLLFGLRISDTQTGLRGIPARMLKRYASLEGDRYEYETLVLLDARETRIEIVELPIETIYLDGNASSHFDTFRDSERIYRLLFRYFTEKNGVSLVATLVDYTVFLLLLWLLPVKALAAAVFGARIVSAAADWLMHRKTDRFLRGKAIPLYCIRVAVMVVASWLGIWALTFLGVSPVLSKFIADVVLFAPSLWLRFGLDMRKDNR